MTSKIKFRRSLVIVSVILLWVVLSTQCIDRQKNDVKNKDGISFVGSASCANCHKNIYEAHINTAHYLTSQPGKEQYLKGSFIPETNTFVLNERVKVVMEKRADSFYQVAYLDGVEKQANSIDIVIGSGTKGQTYLDWTGNRLFQLPVSYFALNGQWTNSPGYPGMIVFNRPISSRCLECHTTNAQTLSAPEGTGEEFDHNKILFGVDCEKCHGPASKHVEFQMENPNDSTAKFILNHTTLSRQQKLDLCILCHGGRLKKTKPSFSFQAGDRLSDFFSYDTVGKSVADIDVHGNQFGLLAASKCFKNSEMTCSTCHNVHENERGKFSVLSERCLNCHNNEHIPDCKMQKTLGNSINQNCIDCHMPKQTSRSITVMLQGADVPTAAVMRTHLIKIYPDETKKVLDTFKVRKVD